MSADGGSIGPYILIRKLGQGGMGAVFLGQHRHIGRLAAIKVLLPELSTNEEALGRFFNEARAASMIAHPGIVEVIDCDVQSGGPAFLVMEYLEGETLGAFIARTGTLAGDLPLLRRILCEVADAVGAAHDKGIVHRDLKPDNIFLRRGAHSDAVAVKVLDFGIAKLALGGTSPASRTQTGNLLGTPLYMSPEQCRGSGTINHRTDIYSLGCIAFEMLTGRPPFSKEGPGELIAAHLLERPAPLPADLPSDLTGLVMRMLEKEPSARPQTMMAVRASLTTLTRPTLDDPGTQPLPRLSARPVGPVPQPMQLTPFQPERPVPERTMPLSPPFVTTPLLPPRAPSVDAARHTTLSRTASELSAMRIRASRRARTSWALAIIATGLAAAGAFAVFSRGDRSDEPKRTVFPSSSSELQPPGPPSTSRSLEMPPPPRAIERDIAVRSTPPGAEVWVSGELRARGRTPLILKVNENASLHAVLRADGFEPLEVDLGASPVAELTLQRKVTKKKSTQVRAPSPAQPVTYPMVGD